MGRIAVEIEPKRIPQLSFKSWLPELFGLFEALK